jgi:outer membrane receptor protein involved in Fe transport
MTRMLSAAGIILALARPVFAQTGAITGTVVDETGAVVPGATVVVTAPGASVSTTTGSRGEYSLSGLAAATYEVTVTLMGFAPATRSGIVVSASTVDVPAITLTVATLAETIVVSASKTESALIDAPATMSVISAEVLATTPAQNYADLLRSVPGINAIQLSARDVNLTNRQATSTLTNSQLVLLDGRSIYLDFFGLVLWDFLPTNLGDIKQIEVVRGPASAVWGANAMTGAVNIITRSPRESVGESATITAGGFSRDAGSGAGTGAGGVFGANAAFAQAPNSRWAYRVSAGYFTSDPLPRPTGQIPIITDPRDPAAKVGGARYPTDTTGPVGTAFQNAGTSQPKFDVRVDQEVSEGRVTYAGGVAGSTGIIHTGIGPFDIQSGSYMGYAKVNYNRKALRANFFTNLVDAEAPNLLLPDPATGRPLQLNFSTQTYDFELGDSVAVSRQVLSFGGNVRRNNFDITIAPTAENRTELGAYLQDEILFDRVRLTVGGRVDKFGNLSDPVFSPRVSATLKPLPDHAVRVSFNKAFRSPSVINNFLDIRIVAPTDLSGLAPLLPAPFRPLVAAPFNLVVRAVGSKLPIGTRVQEELTEESLTAYEVAYIGTIFDRTTVTASFYINDMDDNINFTQLAATLDPYTSANPPPGWPLPAAILDALALQRIFLPRTAFTYLNLGPLRQKGIELSVDHRVANTATAFANYSYQTKPTVLDDPNPFPAAELAFPPTHRFNAGFNVNGTRFLGSASVNTSSAAFWSDVLTSPYHGFTDSYSMVNGSFGVKWARGRVTTSIKGTNLFNKDIQQHVFGDILKRSIVSEVRFNY